MQYYVFLWEVTAGGVAGWGENPPAAVGEQMFVLPPVAGLFLLAAVIQMPMCTIAG